MDASGFLPRSNSKTIFVVAMACYAFAAGSLIRGVATAFGAQHTGPGVLAEHGYQTLQVVSLLVFSPLIESLMLVGLLEAARWLQLPWWAQVALPAATAAGLHAYVSLSLAFVVAPGWAIMSIAYLMWRRVSWKVAFLIVVAIHALLNLYPAIWTVAYATQST